MPEVVWVIRLVVPVGAMVRQAILRRPYFEGDGEVFFFEGSYSDYEINKARRLGNEEIKKGRYRKLMED